MGSDAKRSFAAAEKLLKEQRVSEALVKFNRAIEQTNGDLLTVNRAGDAIASAGHGERAVPYYSKIADQFTRQGFLPKAIAIRKKILRLTPNHVETLVGLGDLCVRQEHSGEARAYYLRAADQLLETKDYDGAREVYERLVKAEPKDARHLVRLAETRAAAGDAAGAAGDLIELGQRLLVGGEFEDAEKAFNRAQDLDPGRHEIVKGRIACLTATNRVEEAIELLESETARPDVAIELVAELLMLYETIGRPEKADGLLLDKRAHEFPEQAFRVLVQFHDGRASMPALWTRLEPVLDTWFADDRKERAIALLDAIDAWLDGAFGPVLERRLKYAEESQDKHTQRAVLERLVAVYRADNQTEQVNSAAKKLAALRPSAAVEEQAEQASADSGDRFVQVAAAAPAGAALGAEVPVEYEAPAVPLSRADEEFVSGRMTQAEILEKYGLLNQAMDQLYEVVERFPGHLEANQRLVTVLRDSSQDAMLAQALVKLALARRAAGRTDVARQSIAEADKLGGVDDNMRRILTALDLIPAESTATPEQVLAAPPATVAPPPAAVRPAAPPATAAPPPAAVAPAAPPSPVPEVEISSADAEAVIDFDAFDDDDEDGADEKKDAIVERQQPPAPAQQPDPTDHPHAPPAAVEIPVGRVAPSLSPRETQNAMRFEPLPALDDDQDDDDLAAIAAALDDELFEGDTLEKTPTSESEESLDEVFAAFRERVDEQIGPDDFRTHYELGIGYKEMGLIDAAVAEFEISVKNEELFQQSCVMLALCCREQAQLDRAVDWYRQAVEALDHHSDDACGLRYDLAETLLEVGDTEKALDLFRDLAEHAPGFRDVSQRVEELAPAGSD